jgi:hypothetical protein
MTPEDQHLDRRAFIKALAGALGGFVREYFGVGPEIAKLKIACQIPDDVVREWNA